MVAAFFAYINLEKKKKRRKEKWEKYSCKFIVHNSDSISRATCAGLFIFYPGSWIHVYDILIVGENEISALFQCMYFWREKKNFFFI